LIFFNIVALSNLNDKPASNLCISFPYSNIRIVGTDFIFHSSLIAAPNSGLSILARNIAQFMVLIVVIVHLILGIVVP
jgi:hypothetical protein